MGSSVGLRQCCRGPAHFLEPPLTVSRQGLTLSKLDDFGVGKGGGMKPSWNARYGPWALVTGASEGIGREIAKDLAQRGLNLILVARRRNLLEALADELQTLHNTQCQVVDADLGDDKGCAAVVQACSRVELGLFVAAAGFGTSGDLVNTELAAELDMLAVNCGAALTLTHYCARRFVEQRRGGIVLLSSIVAFQGVPRAAHYAATKAYVQSLAEGLRVELRPHNVDVLASAPGPVDSGFAKRADMRMGATVTPEQVARGTLQGLGRRLTVRPGLLSKVLEFGLSMLPRRWRVSVMTAVMGGMTRHQRDLQNAESNPRPI